MLTKGYYERTADSEDALYAFMALVEKRGPGFAIARQEAGVALGIPVGSVSRVMSTLIHRGWIEEARGRAISKDRSKSVCFRLTDRGRAAQADRARWLEWQLATAFNEERARSGAAAPSALGSWSR